MSTTDTISALFLLVIIFFVLYVSYSIRANREATERIRDYMESRN